MKNYLVQLQQKDNIEQLIKIKINKHEYLKKILHHYMFYLKEIKEIKKLWNDYEIYNYDLIAKKLYYHLLNFNFNEPEKSIEMTSYIEGWIKDNSSYFKKINEKVKELYDKWDELFNYSEWIKNNVFMKKIFEESLMLKKELKDVNEEEFDKFIYDLENKQKNYYLFIEKVIQIEKHIKNSFFIGEEANNKIIKQYNKFKEGKLNLKNEYEVEEFLSSLLNDILDIKENNIYMNNKYIVFKVLNTSGDEIGFGLLVNGKKLKNNTLNSYSDDELIYENTYQYLYCTNIPYKGIFNKNEPDEMVKLNTNQIKCSKKYVKDLKINFFIGFLILLAITLDVLFFKNLNINLIIGILSTYFLLSILGKKISRNILSKTYKIPDFFSLVQYDFLYVKEGVAYMNNVEINSILDGNLDEFKFMEEEK